MQIRTAFVVLVACATCLQFATLVLAEPPADTARDVLAMRGAPQGNGSPGKLQRVQARTSERETAAPIRSRTAVVELPALHVSHRAARGEADASMREHVEALRHCFDLARRSDPELGGRVTVHLTPGPSGMVRLAVKDEKLGRHHFVRCLQRGYGRFPVVQELAEPGPQTHVLELAADGSAAAAPSASSQPRSDNPSPARS